MEGSGGDLGVQCVHGHLLVAGWASGLRRHHLTLLWYLENSASPQLRAALAGAGPALVCFQQSICCVSN